jgi:ribulose-phosphate 3-epimerase
MVKVAPSILSADFGKMAEAVSLLKEWDADWVHCDVMDGNYVPNITFGMPMIKALRKYSDMFFDVHLMIDKPERYIQQFCDAGASLITFHPDASENVQQGIDIAKKNNVLIGLVVNADKDISIVEPYLSQLDVVLIMTVQAGFGGQSFREDCLKKVESIYNERKKNKYKYLIEIDGGVSLKTIDACKKAGCDVVVAGSAVFNADDKKEIIKQLR